MKTKFALLAITMALFAGANWAAAQGTAFTYQGQLASAGLPASGTYNLQFTLYTNSAGGNAVAGPVTTNGVIVNNGLFTVQIDFGIGMWNGATNWLEIDAETNGAAMFTTLAPRQQVTPVPYAIYSENAGNLLGTLSASSLPASANFTGTLEVNGQPVLTGRASNTIQPGAANSFIGGGDFNIITMGIIGASILGGEHNEATANDSVVGGGTNNMATGNAGVVGGGGNNTASGDHSAVTGGEFNNASGDHSAVNGGSGNTASGAHSVAHGGEKNTANGDHAAVSGGEQNTASGSHSAVGGGSLHTAGGPASFIGGGEGNTTGTNANDSVVGGGTNNMATGVASTIPGGANNSASGQYSFAAGQQAYASYQGDFIWADDSTSSAFSSTGSNQFLIRAQGGVGIDINNPAGASLNVQGGQTGTFANATVIVSNTNSTSTASPALRVNWFGTATGPGPGLAALSVSANNLSGDLAEFGNANIWVVRIVNSGTVYATAFNTTSDRNAKENFAPVSPNSVLAKVAALPISEWNFRTDPRGQKHLGPMAQDFHAAFGLNGQDDKHISVVDEGGVALAATQGLNQEVEQIVKDKDKQIESLEANNRSLEQRLAELEKVVNQLARRNSTFVDH